jgi:hypothetical protein
MALPNENGITGLFTWYTFTRPFNNNCDDLRMTSKEKYWNSSLTSIAIAPAITIYGNQLNNCSDKAGAGISILLSA